MAKYIAFTLKKISSKIREKIRWLFPPSWQEKVVEIFGFNVEEDKLHEIFSQNDIVKIRKIRGE